MKKRRIGLALVIASVALITVLGIGAWNFHQQPVFCSTFCHLMESYVAPWTGEIAPEQDGSPLMAKTHADEGVTCLDCHEPTLKQQIDELQMQLSGEYRDPPRMRKYGQEECLKCHEHATREELIERTKDYQIEYHAEDRYLKAIENQSIYTLGQEGPINPHDFPTDLRNISEPHAEGSPQLECYQCHKSHRESPGIDYCFGCHHSGTFAPCDTCHEARTRSSGE